MRIDRRLLGWGAFLVIAGAILTVAVIIAWIRDTRRDINELPLEHAEH